jgi:hypothetical protein
VALRTERASLVETDVDRQIVRVVEPRERVGPALVRRAGRPEEGARQALAIHAVQREIVHRDQAADDEPDDEQRADRQQILGQRRADRVIDQLVKEIEAVDTRAGAGRRWPAAA